MYKLETHMHTKETSGCAISSAKEMVNAYKMLGYDGIIVTDHFVNGNTTVDTSLSWQEQINAHCKGYENAKAQGDKIGLDVYFGFEYSFYGTDFLTYGVDKNFLIAHPEIMNMQGYEYIDFIHENGGMVVEAHPFRQAFYIKTIRLYPSRIDAIEVSNTSNREEVWNERARLFAESYDLPMTGGSDAHRTDKIKGGMIFENNVNDIFDYIDFVKSKQGTIL